MRSAGARVFATSLSASRRHESAHLCENGSGARGKFSESQTCPSNGRFHHARRRCAGARATLLTAIRPRTAGSDARHGTRIHPIKKNFSNVAESRLQTVAGRGTLRTEARRFANRRSVSFLDRRHEAADAPAAESMSASRSEPRSPVRATQTSLLLYDKAAGTDCVCLMIARHLAHAVRMKAGLCGALRLAALPREARQAHAPCCRTKKITYAKGQMPSFVLSRSFTAWGLALPPEAFMT